MKLTPLRAIKKHCLECSGYEKKQVRECVIWIVFYFLIGLVLIQTAKDARLRKIPLQRPVLKKPTVMYRYKEFIQEMNVERQEILRKREIAHIHRNDFFYLEEFNSFVDDMRTFECF